MKELFDLDYLGKDLTGNAEIQTAVDRGLAFMKLEKWDKALQVFDDLIDLHPESPCGWFGKARLATNDYTVFGLASPDGRRLTAEASTNLEAAIKLIDEERKSEYQRLLATYSEYLKKDLVESYVASFGAFVNTCNSISVGINNVNSRVYMICNAFSSAAAGEDGDFDENTIYAIPPEIITEAGNDYPSIAFAALHILLMNDIMKPYFAAQEKQAHARRVQEARFDQRKRWNQNQGFGYALDRDEVEKLSKECPVYDLSHYFKYTIDANWSLAKLIKDNNVFENASLNDDKVKDVFNSYFKFLKLINLPIGDLKNAGVPNEYYEQIEDELKKIEEEKKEQQEKEAQAEQERRVQQQKAREEAIVKKAEYNSKKWKYVIICLLLGSFGIHNFMMGETKKGIIKLLLCWTGISSLLALVDLFKLITGSYEIP